MKKQITVKELKQGKTLLAFNCDDEVELFCSVELDKFGVLKNGKLIKSSKSPKPCIEEFNFQVVNNNLDTIRKFD